MPAQPWTCPACGRGVRADIETCDHGGGCNISPPWLWSVGVPQPMYPSQTVPQWPTPQPYRQPLYEPYFSDGTNLI